MKQFALFLHLVTSLSLSAQPSNSFALWPDGAPDALGNADKDIPTLTVYLPAPAKASGAAIVICPGGGYAGLAQHEGKSYALWLNEQGVAGFVLKYRLAPGGYHHPAMLQDAARAVRTVRARAEEWKIDPKFIGIMGSSAGGHLASTLVTHFDAGKADAADPIERVSSRPDLGTTLSPGTSIGTMTVNGANLFLNGSSTNHMELDAAANTNDRVQGMAQVTYGGTLEVVNLAGTPTIGQSFQLFSAATTAGSFATINLPALPSDRAWSWNPASGTLSVVPPAATTPTNITFSVSGGNLELTWPGSHLGWIAQSNAVSVADTNFWYDIADSASATNLSISINPVLPQVFYRLRLP